MAQTGKIPPAEGQITADAKAGYVATLAAYQAMIRQAGEIAARINGLEALDKGSRIVIVDTLDVCVPDVQAVQVTAQLDFWRGELEAGNQRIGQAASLLEKAKFDVASVAAAGALAAGVLGAGRDVVSLAADIAGYFRADYDLSGQAVSLGSPAFQALVAGRLDRQKYTVLLPSFHRMASAAAVPVLEKLNQCLRERDRLNVQVARLRGLLAAKGPEDSGKGEARARVSEQEMACREAEDLIGRFAGFNEGLVTVPKGAAHSPLAAAAARQYLDGMGASHLLYLGVASSGGEMITGKGPFHLGHVAYLGGCVLSYILAKSSGEIILADTVMGNSSARYRLCGHKLTGPA